MFFNVLCQKLSDRGRIRRELEGPIGAYEIVRIVSAVCDVISQIAASDGFVFVTPEYTDGRPRETAIEIQIAPIRSSVHTPVATLWAHFQGGDVDEGLAELDKQTS